MHTQKESTWAVKNKFEGVVTVHTIMQVSALKYSKYCSMLLMLVA